MLAAQRKCAQAFPEWRILDTKKSGDQIRSESWWKNFDTKNIYFRIEIFIFSGQTVFLSNIKSNKCQRDHFSVTLAQNLNLGSKFGVSSGRGVESWSELEWVGLSRGKCSSWNTSPLIMRVKSTYFVSLTYFIVTSFRRNLHVYKIVYTSTKLETYTLFMQENVDFCGIFLKNAYHNAWYTAYRISQ